MRRFRLVSGSPQETKEIGVSLAHLLRGGELICLEGELGSGKTTFIQGLGQGLGVERPITSPTFTLVNEYRGGRLPLYHVDLFRIGSEMEIRASGLEEFFWDEGVCAVEWAEKAVGLLPPERLWITFEHGGRERRFLSLEAKGFIYDELLAALEAG